MYIKRNLRQTFQEANTFFPALLVIGARQVGKTTFLSNIAEPSRRFVSLDFWDVPHVMPWIMLEREINYGLTNEIEKSLNKIPCPCTGEREEITMHDLIQNRQNDSHPEVTPEQKIRGYALSLFSTYPACRWRLCWMDVRHTVCSGAGGTLLYSA